MILYSCLNKNEKDSEHQKREVVKDTLHMDNDSFNVRNMYINPSLQPDIHIDTIQVNTTNKHTGITIFHPKFSGKECATVNMQVNALIKKKKDEFYEMIKDEKVIYDTGMKTYEGWSMGIGPVCLYRTDKVISICIENGSGFTGMPSGFEYNVINYDIENGKKISFKDYFILNNAVDSLNIERLIGRAMGREAEFRLKEFIEYRGGINFSFDDTCVYIYLDKYDVLGWGISSIKKKYIREHINPRYR